MLEEQRSIFLGLPKKLPKNCLRNYPRSYLTRLKYEARTVKFYLMVAQF